MPDPDPDITLCSCVYPFAPMTGHHSQGWATSQVFFLIFSCLESPLLLYIQLHGKPVDVLLGVHTMAYDANLTRIKQGIATDVMESWHEECVP